MTPQDQPSSTIDAFALATEEFNQKALSLGLGDLTSYYWYHTISLPNGLVTPGVYDYRKTYSSFCFPDDMRGMSVLDVGSATGFFAFEFARRGAHVTSLELPSLQALDLFPGQTVEESIAKIGVMMGSPRKLTAEQMYFYLLDGPFEFCRKLLDAEVTRCFATVYQIPESFAGTSGFDLVFMGDILLHTLNPLQALAAAASVCKGTLVLAQGLPGLPDDPPAMIYKGGDDPSNDELSWWWPNQACLTQLLKKLGFATVVDAGHHTGVVRRGGYAFDRTILHAIRK